VVKGNVVAVGDAAGLLDPLSGEGIFGAIWSGRQAAIRVEAYLSGAADSLEGYQTDIERDLALDLDASRELHALFHLAPRVWATLVRRSPRAFNLVCALITGEMTYHGIKRRSRVLRYGIEYGARAAWKVPGIPSRPPWLASGPDSAAEAELHAA
jgi:flavin-dependent dehydrogenase